MGPAAPLAGDLIGRDSELTTTRALLESNVRLLTLSGPPGVGKTRLALELAARCAPQFTDGFVFVDLTATRDQLGAMNELARSLGVEGGPGDDPALRVRQGLMGHRELLVVLDNAEQVEGLAGELGGLLQVNPALRLLVTSRENLHLSQEHQFAVPPLAMPWLEDPADLDRFRLTPSVALFVAAARAVRPEFDVSAQNAPAIAEICVRLDGLPLALTLAAPRVKVFSPAEIAARLRDRTALLEATARDVPARHRSLQAAISWSHALLSEDERLLFRRASVFATPWTIEQAAYVCRQHDGGPVDIVGTISSLVDKSLVQPVVLDGPEQHFVMLESIRDFAGDHRSRHDDGSLADRHHKAYFVQQSVFVESAIGTQEEQVWFDWASRHERDLRTALDHAAADADLAGALALTTALGWSWYTRGHLGAGKDVVEDVLARVDAAADVVSPHTLAPARIIGGVLSWAMGDLERAALLLTDALDSTQRVSDGRRTAMAMAFLGHVARDRGDFVAATASHQRAASLYDDLGIEMGAAWSRFDLGRVAWERGNLSTASGLLADALSRFRRLDYFWGVAWTAWATGTVLVERGVTGDGAGFLASSLTEFERASDLRGAALCWESLATVADSIHRPGDCVRLVTAAAVVRDRLLAPQVGAELSRVTLALKSARAHLGDYDFDLSSQDGRTLPMTSAYALAYEIVAAAGQHPTTGAKPRPGWHVLTTREREVATLVADGATNQQIGRCLGIAARTAEAHVHNIMAKLDARNRAEVAAWAATRRAEDG